MFANVMLVASIATFAIVVKEIHSYFKEVNKKIYMELNPA